MVWSIAVSPEHQGKRLGKALIEHAKRRASDSQIPCLRLHTNSKNTKNIRLYEELGFYQTATIPHPGREDYELVYMQFDL